MPVCKNCTALDGSMFTSMSHLFWADVSGHQVMNTALVLEAAEAIGKAVRSMGFEVALANTLADARLVLDQCSPGLILMDINLPDGSGLSLVEELELGKNSRVIFITGDRSKNTAIDCMRVHASDLLQKPFDVVQLKEALKRCELEPLAGQNCCSPEQPPENQSKTQIQELQRDNSALVTNGKSAASIELRNLVDLASQEPFCTTLIEGEAGAGKAEVARLIHSEGVGSGKLITVDCSRLQGALGQIQMFGELDPETGDVLHRGFVERAAAGTLLLENLTQLPLDIQARLVSVIDTGLFLRTNALNLCRSKPRIIGISRDSVSEAVDKGLLREDFLIRMSRFHIRVPTLAQRRDDIGLFALSILEELNYKYGTHCQFSDETLQDIEEAPWHGNLPQLREAIERSLQASPDSAVLVLDQIGLLRQNGLEARTLKRHYLGVSLWDLQRDLLFATLAHCDGDKVKASETLGISLKTLYNRLRDYQ